MGLFDIFKKKKDEKSDVVDSNGQVQVQPEGIQVVTTTESTTNTSDTNTTIGADNQSIQTNNLNIEVNRNDSDLVSSVNELTNSVDNSNVPTSLTSTDSSVDTMNQVVDNDSPAQVESIGINDEKDSSEEIVPVMEDVAALIDSPIPAKSEEENMSVNPEEILNGGVVNQENTTIDNSDFVEVSAFREDNAPITLEEATNAFEEVSTPSSEPTINLDSFSPANSEEVINLESSNESGDAEVQDNPFKEDNTNLLENIVSNDDSVVSHNDPLQVSSIETVNKDEEIQDLSSNSQDSSKSVDIEPVEDAQENIEETVESVDDLDDTVIKVDDDVIEESNIFKETKESDPIPEFVPIVVDENEEDVTNEGISSDDESKQEDSDNSKESTEDDFPSSTMEFADMISEVTTLRDEALPDSIVDIPTIKSKEEETISSDSAPELEVSTIEDSEEEKENTDEKIEEPEDETENSDEVEKHDDETESQNETEKHDEEVHQEEIEEPEDEAENSDEVEEHDDETESQNETEKHDDETHQEEIEEPVIVEEEESNIFNVENDDNEKEENTEEPLKTEEKEIEVEDEYDGPYLEEETSFTIFDLPPIPPEYDVEEDSKEDEEDIIIDLDDNKEDSTIIEEESEFEEDKEKEEEDKIDEELADMYSQLEFKNEKIRFCDNCGAMILGESATVCPSCGEPL